MQVSETRYARSGDVHIAYQTAGEGSFDLLFVPGAWSHLEYAPTQGQASARRFAEFARVIRMDKRGTGLSDRLSSAITYEDQMDDITAVMDAAGCDRAAMLGFLGGGTMAAMFAATHPERATALITFSAYPRLLKAPDYPLGIDRSEWEAAIDDVDAKFDLSGLIKFFAPKLADNEAFVASVQDAARAAAGPGGAVAYLRAIMETDVRAILPTIRVPALVAGLDSDEVAACGAEPTKLFAALIPGAKLVLLPGDNVLGIDRQDLMDAVEEFLTGAHVTQRAPTDRVLATCLFADVVRSTEQLVTVGDRSWRDLLDRFEGLVERQIDRFRGTLIKTTGDGFLGTFDGPARAINCAQAIVAGAKAVGLDVRAGIHTGEVERRGTDIAGVSVHIASRIMDEAGPGEVFVSSMVRDLAAGSGIRFRELGSRELRGVPGPWLILRAESEA